jgi:hypothetical protein
MKQTLLAVIVLALFVLPYPCAAEDGKPIALVGASYGVHEVKSIIRNVLSASRENQYVYKTLGDSINVADLNEYSLIIIAHSIKKPFTDADSKAMEAYLKSGGHLLLINSAPRSIAGKSNTQAVSWLGMKRVSWHRKGLPCKAIKADHPLLTGVFEDNPAPKWLNGSLLAFVKGGDMKNILGTKKGDCLFGMRKVGKGWVAYLGHELFRLRSARAITRPDTPSWIRLIGNIVADAKPLRQSDVRKEALKAATGKDLLVWNRGWQKGEPYGPRFVPPLPTKAECITALSADMAMGEYETLQLNLTPLKDLGAVSWGFETGDFPKDKVQLYVQDRPEPIPWKKNPAIAKEFPYWLMPPEYVAPKGSPAFTAPVKETRILWVKLNSHGVDAGDYALTLHLKFAKGKEVTLPIKVKVYPVALPRHRLITLMPGGTVYGDANKAAIAVRFMKNLKSHGFEWSIFNAVRSWKCAIRGKNTFLDTKYLAANRAKFLAGEFPTLDFRTFDPWVELSIAHNQTNFRMGDVNHYLRGNLKRARFEADEMPPIEQWFSREFSRYMREKGVRLMVTSIGDELSVKELHARWLPWAKRMTDAGWGCASTFSGMAITTPELNAALFPYVKLWTLNRGTILPFVEGLKSGRLKVRPDAVIGTYGAGEGRGTEFRKHLSMSRFLGWESWMLGVENCMPNPYFKSWIYYCDYRTKDYGIGGERFVSYVDKDNLKAPLADSPFLEGIREGMEDGNLCAMLSWYLDKMEAAGGGAATKARATRKSLDKILGNGPSATIKWKAWQHRAGYRAHHIKGTNPDFRKGKAQVLDLIASIRNDALRTVKPSLYWNDVQLIKDGKPVAAIYTTGAATDDLSQKTRALCGMALPVMKNAARLDARYPVAIILGNGAKNPLAARVLTAQKTADASAAYPGTGGYFIKEFGQGARRTLLVAGPDDAGTSKGVALFQMFLHAKGAWIKP